MQIDPIRLEVLRNSLISSAEEMSVVVQRTARSMIVREGRDFSTAIFDTEGRNIVQAALIPLHLNTMAPFLMEILARHMPIMKWNKGDMIIANDPYCGGQHLPDVTSFQAIFVDGQHIGFVGVMSHHLDIGGGVPGSFNMRARDIFAEGLRIPPIKIYRGGVLAEDILGLLMHNSRTPESFRGDLMAQFGAMGVGVRNVEKIARKYGTEFLTQATRYILDQSEMAMRTAIAAAPDGTYRFEDLVDNEADPTSPVLIRVTVTIAGDTVSADFSGSSDQVAGPINCTENITRSAAYYALMVGLADHLAPNSGCYRPIGLMLPQGSVLNCNFPAPVVNRMQVCHRVVNVVLGALAQALPQRIPAAPYGTTCSCAVEAIFADGSRKVFIDSEIGGWGGEPFADGPSGFPCGIHNVANTPIEIHEANNPMRFITLCLIPDSGGAGTYRGGLGLRREWRFEAERGSLSASINRFQSRPYGLAGGAPGSHCSLTLIKQDGTVEQLTGALIDQVPLRHGDIIRLETAGGGGFGPARNRLPERLQRDLAEGYITPQAAALSYGVDSP